MPKNENENLNLIEIIDKEKKVYGKNWDQFAEEFEKTGWTNAKNDNFVRAFFNLCGPEQKAITSWAQLILEVIPSIDNVDDYKISIGNSVEAEILEKAKRKTYFKFEENQRESVLVFQESQAKLLNHKYDFNKDHPAPQPEVQNNNNQEEKQDELNQNLNINEVDNNEVNLEENNNEVKPEENEIKPEENEIKPEENGINNDNNSINNAEEEVKQTSEPEPEEEIQVRQPKTKGELNVEATEALRDMDVNTLTLRGSTAYKEAREEFRKVQYKWKQTLNETPINELSEEQAKSLRNELNNAMYLTDVYLGNKMLENDNSANATLRKAAMQKGFDVLEEMIYALEARIDNIYKEKAPTFDELSVKSSVANKGIEDAKLFLRGSSEFKEAAESYEKANKKMAELSKKYKGKEEEITTAELEELDSLFSESIDSIGEYMGNKFGTALDDNGRKRTEAMSNARTVLQGARRRIEELLQAKEAKPVMESSLINSGNISAKNHILEAEEGVHFGSKEYETAKNDYLLFTSHIEDITGSLIQGEIQPTRRELDRLDAYIDKASASIDTYLATKKGEDLGEKTQKRVDAMREAKENLIETKKLLNVFINKRRAMVSESSIAVLQSNEEYNLSNLTETKTHVAGEKVYFGGADYDKALELYEKAVGNEKKRDVEKKKGTPSKGALLNELKELKAAQDATLVYIERKEKEQLGKRNGDLGNKGMTRLKNMREAYNDLGKRIDNVTTSLETLIAAEKEPTEKQMNKIVAERKNAVPGKKGFDKILAISASEDAVQLQRLAGQRTLSEIDKNNIKLLAASEILRNKYASDPSFKKPVPASAIGFGKMVTAIANSKEFNAAFTKKITPETAKLLLTSPGEVKKLNARFVENCQKTAGKQKTVSTQPQMNREATGPSMGGK
jgi:hypothetical protein